MTVRAGEECARAEEILLSTEILRSPAQILTLSQVAPHLLSEEVGTRRPDFFLASVDTSTWAPIVAVVARANSIVGLVYAKERKFAGIPSGLVYADAILDAMVVASPADREPVLSAALRGLIDYAGIRGLRVVVPPTGFERDAVYKLLESRRLDVHYARVENHNVLDLPPNYEAFLENLGKRTRRNFRYYRRRFEDQGNTYIKPVHMAEFRCAASELVKKCSTGTEPNVIERTLNMIAAARNPILVGLRDKNGEWLSILGGWYESGRAVVLLQLNNVRDHPHSALCTVLRGYLIEGLIAGNIRSLLFWGGAVGPLRPYCQFLPAVRTHLDSPTFTWRTLRGLIAWTSGFLPERLRMTARWVAPRLSQEHGESV